MADLTTPVRILDGEGNLVCTIESGGAEAKLGAKVATIYLHRGDLVNIRNVQGGTVENPNLDISAGGAGGPDDPRGVVVVNHDNGRGFDIGSGRPNRKHAFVHRSYDDARKDLATFNIPVRFAAGAYHHTAAGWVKFA